MTERRRGPDRRAVPRDTPERRGRGRPPLPPELRPVTLHIKFPPSLYDAVYRFSRAQGLSIHGASRRLIALGLEYSVSPK